MATAIVDAMHDDRTYRRVEVITGRRRRRNWAPEEKDRIVGECLRGIAPVWWTPMMLSHQVSDHAQDPSALHR